MHVRAVGVRQQGGDMQVDLGADTQWLAEIRCFTGLHGFDRTVEHFGKEGEAHFLDFTGLGVSQHLARMREEKLVDTRRDAQQIFYRVADPRVRRILSTLKTVYC